jgi:hypothetical protein
VLFDDENTLTQIIAMPTVMRIGPYRFHFYSREGSEPPHIHVEREEWEAKFWLSPVSLAANHGFAKAELSHIQRLVEEHCQKLISAYIQWHGH